MTLEREAERRKIKKISPISNKNGHTEVARLLDSGADATLANDQMSTPLQLAVDQGREEVISLLLSHCMDI
jgi:ankyrin repeat protein